MKYFIVFASLFFIFSCSTAGIKNIEYSNFDRSTTVQKSFDDVWSSVMEWSALKGFPIESVDKEAGIITLSASGVLSQSFFQAPINQGKGADLDQSLVSCGEATGNIGLYTGKFADLSIRATIILRDLGDSTRVTVNFSGNAVVEVRNSVGLVSRSNNTCPSRGIFERELFTDLNAQ
jgi:hypothetical protein